jgi:hypothetical protein
MNSVEEYIDIAQGLQDKGKIEEALETFSKGFDLMVDDAGKYARTRTADVSDLEELRKMTPILFAYSKEYYRCLYVERHGRAIWPAKRLCQRTAKIH